MKIKKQKNVKSTITTIISKGINMKTQNMTSKPKMWWRGVKTVDLLDCA